MADFPAQYEISLGWSLVVALVGLALLYYGTRRGGDA